jgi:hypothetical protein
MIEMSMRIKLALTSTQAGNQIQSPADRTLVVESLEVWQYE